MGHGPGIEAISRRGLLRSVAALAGLAVVPGGLIACADDPDDGAGEMSLGSNYSDEVPRAAIREVLDAFEAATGIDVLVNTVDAGTFQDRIGPYLQGRPDDVLSWFAGERMRFFAGRDLLSPLDEVWDDIDDLYTDAYRKAVSGEDGRPYLVPFQTYPWVVLYRRSVFDEHDYAPPTTFDELLDLCRRMRDDGLVPLAFADRDGWPAMGTFDILDLRLNGYDFHLALMEGRERWTDERVAAVFRTWRQLLPVQQEGALGRTWQEAAQGLMAGRSGMYFMGTFAAEQATEDERADLDMFTFPLLGTEYDDERAIEAPINGFAASRAPADPEAADALLRFLGTGAAQDIYVSANPSRIATAGDADRSGYTPLQRRMVEVIEGAGRIAQFMDRDTRPDFAGPNGMQRFLQEFLAEPERDLGPFLEEIQVFRDSLDR